MKTYQDLERIGDNEKERMAFMISAINDHKSSDIYKTAYDADMYYRHMNPTIMRAQKFVYNMMGKAVPDIYSANNKIPCRYYFYFITQAVQFLLGNGISFKKDSTKKKLGDEFDYAVQKAATYALNAGVSFGFWNYDHLEVFSVAQSGNEPAFVPLYDEETGALRAGVRYWQISDNYPLRCTMYEEDGVTEYIRRVNEDMVILRPKTKYKQITDTSIAGDVYIYGSENYTSIPIVPLYNINRQSEIVGTREILDAYDLMASQLVNNVDDGNLIYWIIKNCNGMDDIDDQKFVERLKTIHVAHADGDEGAEVTAHTVEIPYNANEAALDRLRKLLFDSFMALDVKEISNGAVSATQIRAAYEPLNEKIDLFEYYVTDFIQKILTIAGIDDVPSYTRSMIVNRMEDISSLVSAGDFLPKTYILKKIVEMNGDLDKLEEIQKDMEEQEAAGITVGDDDGDEGGEEGEGSAGTSPEAQEILDKYGVS